MNLLPLQLELKLQAVTAFAPAATKNKPKKKKQSMISDHSCMIYSNGNFSSGSSNYKSCTAEHALDVVCCFQDLGAQFLCTGIFTSQSLITTI
jgi:hypothetical protein